MLRRGNGQAKAAEYESLRAGKQEIECIFPNLCPAMMDQVLLPWLTFPSPLRSVCNAQSLIFYVEVVGRNISSDSFRHPVAKGVTLRAVLTNQAGGDTHGWHV
ncbi:hypothetical protein Mic7113_2090 [Allocoleopsis franciscana PCC 7113]|uniref:Uncharacterized protein n=1 Tax=Allocoleopsis franciscana PCC 7113 TaxID=1173027 RepID=K9WED9_9CYAN|nr:hypothetical protein Mic7113_2090 [Allocoleopsis franciscana PCC 7113]